MSLNTRSVYTVAKKEFIDHIRNRWILLFISIFFILTLVAAFLAGQEIHATQTLGGFQATVTILLAIATLLIPLIAIMLGFATIAGEAENGALALVLSYPIQRSEVLVGKFLGLGGILAFTTTVGFGIGGVVIALTSGSADLPAYLAFIGFTILLGLMFLSPIICMSARFKRRITAIGGGIFLFFWSSIYRSIMIGIFFANGGSLSGLMGGKQALPSWMWLSMAASPADTYQTTVLSIFNEQQAFGISTTLPGYLPIIAVLYMLLWIIVPILLAYFFFSHRDI
jgi:Cu-processing system permease protein